MDTRRYRFPAEVVDEIFTYATNDTLVSLCLTSKALNTFATRILYRSLSLKDPSQIVRCLNTMLRNPLAAESCRKLKLGTRIEVIPEKATQLGAFFRLIAKTLPTLYNLRKITITVAHWFPWTIKFGESVDFIFQECTFPYLEDAELQMPITPCIARFLERHQQTLKSVTLGPVGIQNNPTFQPITYHFPCLDSFFGNAALALSFFQSVPDALPEMEYMMVNWGFFEDFDFRELIKAMEKRCPKQQPIDLSFNRMGWNEDLIEEISQRFPQVQELTIDCSEMDDEDELQQETLEAVAQSLKKCKALTDFSWTVVREDPETFEDRSVENWNIEKDMSNVMLLSDACPSLDYCRAPHGVTWVRYICGFWFPLHLPKDRISVFPSMMDLVNRRMYPPLPELLEYMEACYELGEFVLEVVAKFKETESLDVECAERKEATMSLMAIGRGIGIWRYAELEHHPVTRRVIVAIKDFNTREKLKTKA